MRRLGVLGAMVLWTACATTPVEKPPAAPEARATQATRPVEESGEDELARVSLDFTEVTVRIEADGSSVRTWRERYRLLSAEPSDAWAHVFAFWRPWLNEAPRIDATVTSPDGEVRRLDPATVSDQPWRNEQQVITDDKLRIAPLPALSLGSIVERSTTTKSKPLFVAGSSGAFSFATSAPEAKRVLVIDAPAGVPLHLEVFDTDAVMTRTERDGRVIVRYERGPAHPRRVPEGGETLGTAPEPQVRFSTVADWQAAATAWTARVEPQLDVAALKALATKVTAGQASREARAAAILAWVRGNVRYTGLELDEAAWVPRRAGEVLERKYGDCKDLSVLVTAMLRAVDLDADLALLSAGFDRDTTPGTPGLSGFNHAIVRLRSGPTLWLDPTEPWSALGEVPASVVGRRALVARRDVTALEPVTASAVSTLDTKFDWHFAPSGRGRIERKRVSDGMYFSDGREVAAASREQYRKDLERWARESHGSSAKLTVDVSEPAAAGPFVEQLTVPDSNWAVTSAEDAAGYVAHDTGLGPIRFLFDLEEEQLEKRTAAWRFRVGSRAHVVNHYHLPPGYRLAELPEDVREAAGPAKFSLGWRRVGDDLEATFDVELVPGDLTADDARRFVRELYPRLDAALSVPSVVLSAIAAGRYHLAVKEAEALLAQNPSPTWRSLLGYALASAGLQQDAEVLARKALAEAPNDPLVRNRLAFVLIHNDRGIEFGPGYRRDEVRALLEASLALEPDNEWTRRMHALVLLYDEQNTFVSDPATLAKLDTELADYRAKTHGTSLDDEAIDVMLKRKDWKRLLSELPSFPQTTQRDAALAAAQLVLKGPETAFTKGGQERRLDEKSLGLALQYVVLAREYETFARAAEYSGKLAARQGRPRPDDGAVQALLKLVRVPPPPAGSVEAAWGSLTAAVLANAPLSAMRPLVDGALTENHLRDLRRAFARIQGDLPRGSAEPVGYMLDLIASQASFERRPVPGFGELVTLRLKTQGLSAPETVLMTRGPRGYLVRLDAGPALAAKMVEHLQAGRRAEARELLHALVLLLPNAPAALREERAGSEEQGFAWAARLSTTETATPPHVVRWYETQLERADLDEATTFLLVDGLERAWRTAPDKRLALAKKLGGANRSREELAFNLSLRALSDDGKYAAALALVEQRLASAPRDRQLLERKAALLAHLGRFEDSRALSLQLASELDPKDQGGYLNDASWWSLYGTVDEVAVQQIQRAREQSSSWGAVNTAVCVYAAAGKLDLAAQEYHRMANGVSALSDAEVSPSFFLARGLLAEGFGRVDLARDNYKRVKKGKAGSAADVWHLAQKRLSQLDKR